MAVSEFSWKTKNLKLKYPLSLSFLFGPSPGLGEKKLILQLLLKLLIALNELFYQTVMYIKGLKLKIVFLIQICLFKGG